MAISAICLFFSLALCVQCGVYVLKERKDEEDEEELSETTQVERQFERIKSLNLHNESVITPDYVAIRRSTLKGGKSSKKKGGETAEKKQEENGGTIAN